MWRFICTFFLSWIVYIHSFSQSDSLNLILQTIDNSIKNGQYDSSLIWIDKGLGHAKNIPNQDSVRAFLLTNKANVYLNLADYEKAEKIYKKSYDLFINNLGTNNFSALVALGGMANAIKQQGKYSAARKLYHQVIESLKEINDQENFFYANMLNSLAQVNQINGNYLDAEKRFKEAQLLYQKLFGKQHYYNSIANNNLAHLYMALGHYPLAEKYFKLSLHIIEPLIEKESENLNFWHSSLMTQENLAILKYLSGNLEQAIQLQTTVLAKRKEKFGEYHLSYIKGLNNIGTFYQVNQDFHKAINYYYESLEKDTIAGSYNSLFCQINLAYAYQQLNKYDSAKKYYTKADLKSQQNQLSWFDQLSLSRKRADFFAATHQLDKAYNFYQSINKEIKTHLYRNFKGLSEAQQARLLTTLHEYFEEFYTFSFRFHQQEPAITGMSYDNALMLKELLLNQNQHLKKTLSQTEDKNLRTNYQQWMDYQEQLAMLYSIPVDSRQISTDSIQQSVQLIEQELKQQSKLFQQLQVPLQSATWQEVQQRLKYDEAAIEFVHFTRDTTVQYAALLLRKQDKYPKMIALCTESALKQVMAEETVENLYASRGGGIVEMIRPSRLYQLIWRPLDSLLSNSNTIYFAASGLLNQVSFAALPCNEKYLFEKYDLVQLSSTRKITATVEEIKPVSAALFGGIFYQSGEELFASANEEEESAFSLLPATRGQEVIWKYLPGSLDEVEYVQQKLKSANVSTQLFTGYNATESRIKTIGQDKNHPSPTLLHIATHGFFISEKKKEVKLMKNVFRLTEDPMLKGGLLMAGANRAWQGHHTETDKEDGVLTGYEIAQLDLSDTKVVVLSACETGLGESIGSEGVYGLQRAFKKAGVKFLIMSLWKVPDQETSQFMQFFYDYWIEAGKCVHESFRLAQYKMSEQYDASAWAAFILLR